MKVTIKRVYEEPAAGDGKRVLIDRLWPRGLTKDKAKIDLWLKTVAPSESLRKWFNHDPAKWPEFDKRYRAELDANPMALDELRTYIGDEPATLLFGAKDEQHNNAVVLQDYLQG